MNNTHASIALVLCVAAQGCSSDPSDPAGSTIPAAYDPNTPYSVDISGADLATEIQNSFFPAPVGATWTYEGQTEEGVERIDIEVLAETKDVWGATARVIRDTVFLADVMIEDTWDWYGEDADGNVWYLGEDTTEYEDGVEVCNCGAWESGVDGALPGVVMLAAPKVGDTYRQEYYAGEAEDYAKVVEVDVSVTVPAGSFTGCIKTNDLSALDPEADEYKTYCPGVGVVLEESGDERVELLEYSGL